VQSLPFEATRNIQPPPDPPKPGQPAPTAAPNPPAFERYLRNPMALVGAGGGVAALVALLWLMRRRKKRKAKVEMSKTVGEGAAKGEIGTAEADPLKQKMQAKLAEQAALTAAEEQEQLQALSAARTSNVHSKKAEVLCKHIGEEVKRDPLLVAQVVRAWMHERER